MYCCYHGSERQINQVTFWVWLSANALRREFKPPFNSVGCVFIDCFQNRYVVGLILETKDPYLPLVKSWLASDAEAAKYYTASVQWHKQNFPSSYREIDGLAVGAQVSVDDLQLINLESDLQLICGASCAGTLRAKAAPSHCSDVLSLSPALLAHNEDNDDYILRNGLSYFVQTPDWTAFCYAGQLCGNAFSVNRFGIALSSNQLWPLRSQPPKKRYQLFEGVATNYALRATLSMPSVSSSAQYYQNSTFITGFSANFVSKSAAVNVETAFDQCTTTPITQPTGHFNVCRAPVGAL